MTDFSEIILMLAVWTYLFKEANDFTLTAAIGFSVFCAFNFIRSAYRAAKVRHEAHKRAEEFMSTFHDGKSKDGTDVNGGGPDSEEQA